MEDPFNASMDRFVSTAKNTVQKLMKTSLPPAAASNPNQGPMEFAPQEIKAQAPATAPPEATPVPDERLTQLQQKQGDLSKERMDVLQEALATKPSSKEDKVAQALMAILPGIAGTLIGGAVAGKLGAAAGAAGGFEGSEKALGMQRADKEQQRKEALEKAGVLGARGDKLDQEILMRQEQIDKGVDVKENRKQLKELEIMKEKSAGERGAAQNKSSEKVAGIHAQASRDVAKINALSDAEKLDAAAGKSGKGEGDLKEFQGKAATFASDMLTAKEHLDGMRDPSFWNTLQSWNGFQSALSDPNRQRYARAVKVFLNAVLRHDTGAAISEKEYNDTFHQYFPLLGSSEPDMNDAQKYRDQRISMMLAEAGTQGTEAVKRTQQLVGSSKNSANSDNSSEKPRGHYVNWKD